MPRALPNSRPLAFPRILAGARTAFVVGACALTVLVLAGPARAADAWSRLVAPERVDGGVTITLRLPDAPPGVDEYEVLLSLDDGRTFPLRVTPELAAGARDFAWRVPAYAARAARLRLRYREGGSEHDGEISEPFEIVAIHAERDSRVFHECGWWEGLDAATAPWTPGWGDACAPVLTAFEAPGGFVAAAGLPPVTPPASRLMRRVRASSPRAFSPVPARTPFERLSTLRI